MFFDTINWSAPESLPLSAFPQDVPQAVPPLSIRRVAHYAFVSVFTEYRVWRGRCTCVRGNNISSTLLMLGRADVSVPHPRRNWRPRKQMVLNGVHGDVAPRGTIMILVSSTSRRGHTSNLGDAVAVLDRLQFHNAVFRTVKTCVGSVVSSCTIVPRYRSPLVFLSGSSLVERKRRTSPRWRALFDGVENFGDVVAALFPLRQHPLDTSLPLARRQLRCVFWGEAASCCCCCRRRRCCRSSRCARDSIYAPLHPFVCVASHFFAPGAHYPEALRSRPTTTTTGKQQAPRRSRAPPRALGKQDLARTDRRHVLVLRRLDTLLHRRHRLDRC
mmetsp:Transcript_22590/g.57210  ORF Transcript_22590/g.57210 Transcript_22590/m.57210 type:complete len:330 (+) Transcript_22590:1947-2936(+)